MNKINIQPGAPILQAVSAKIFEQEAIREAFQAVTGMYSAIATNYFIAGCQVSTNTVGSTTTVTLTEGWAVFQGEPIRVPGDTIDHDVSEVVWLAPHEEAVDAEQYLNNEGVPINLLLQRTLKLFKGENYPASSDHLRLDGKRQVGIMAELLNARLKRVGEITMINTAEIPLSNFDSTGLGKPATNAEGLAICNGNNGTIDLRGLAPVGATEVPSSGAGSLPSGVESTYNPGDVFGKETHQLTTNELPKFSLKYIDTKPHFASGTPPIQNGDGHVNTETEKDTSEIGNDEAHENRQPSRAVVFVQVVS